MICIDGIIFLWHRNGGIGVYFNELIGYFDRELIEYRKYTFENHDGENPGVHKYLKPRIFERYRRFNVDVKYDIFHSSYYRIPQDPKINSVVTVHDFIYELAMPGPRQWLHSWQKFKAIRRANHVICISENTKKDLLHFFPDFPPENITTIYNGVSDIFRPLMEKPHSYGARPFVIFVGARGGYKNFEKLARALVLLSEIDLVCVGGGDLRPTELSMLDSTIPKRYRHLGHVSTEGLNKLYNAALCLVYPSEYEGFGIPVIESMRSGCPVIALNRSSIPEISGGCGLLINEAEPRLLAGAIESMLDNSRRRVLAEKGIIWSRNFSWERTAKATVAVYERLLGRSIYRSAI